MYKAGYVKYLISNEDDIQFLAKKSPEWIQRKEVCIMEDVQKKDWRMEEHAYRRRRIWILDNFEK